jgi:hypothetical protein
LVETEELDLTYTIPADYDYTVTTTANYGDKGSTEFYGPYVQSR